MDLARRLRAEARRVDERRLLVLAGDPETTRERAVAALDAADVDHSAARYVGRDESLPLEQIGPRRAEQLLGTTWQSVVVDCHDTCRPNAIGRAVGAVDGGGLFVLLTPPLDAWPDRRDAFDATLAVPPFDRDQVIGYVRRRLVRTLRAHRGVAIVDVDAGVVKADGIVDPSPRLPRRPPSPPPDHRFPAAAYDACLTRDQVDAVGALERLLDGDGALVVEADRGRGKSSAAGIAAASLALDGNDVLVTAPTYRNAAEVFVRAADLLRSLGKLTGSTGSPPRRVETPAGRVRFERPPAATDLPGDPDCLVADEAAAVPVRHLEAFLAADAVAFVTTVHGYEGAGRGFSVRFRDRLAESDHAVTDVTLDDPIRYAPADPIEVWAFRALCLDARLAVDPLVEGAEPSTVSYRRLSAADILADENLLREVFGLLVAAHYRTEPNDLARLLDAPNVTARALLDDGHVVSVALLAREGGLPADLRARMYEGERVRGNMIPDVLTSQLRDERAGEPVGWRVLRIATHGAARSRGLGSHLLGRVRDEAARAGDVDYLGVGYGATPELVPFWRENEFRTVHLSTTRHDTSGEYSAVMLDPLTPTGADLADRHTSWFLRRLPATLADPLDDVAPDVVRELLRTVDARPDIDLSAAEWRVVVGTAEGMAIHDTAPRPFRRLAVRHLVAPADSDALGDRAERLLVQKCLQARPWDSVAEELAFDATAECKRALGDVAGTLADLYGDDVARAQRERFG